MEDNKIREILEGQVPDDMLPIVEQQLKDYLTQETRKLRKSKCDFFEEEGYFPKQCQNDGCPENYAYNQALNDVLSIWEGKNG